MPHEKESSMVSGILNDMGALLQHCRPHAAAPVSASSLAPHSFSSPAAAASSAAAKGLEHRRTDISPQRSEAIVFLHQKGAAAIQNKKAFHHSYCISYCSNVPTCCCSCSAVLRNYVLLSVQSSTLLLQLLLFLLLLLFLVLCQLSLTAISSCCAAALDPGPAPIGAACRCYLRLLCCCFHLLRPIQCLPSSPSPCCLCSAVNANTAAVTSLLLLPLVCFCQCCGGYSAVLLLLLSSSSCPNDCCSCISDCCCFGCCCGARPPALRFLLFACCSKFIRLTMPPFFLCLVFLLARIHWILQALAYVFTTSI